MINRKPTQKSKNKSSIRSGARVASLITQLLALVIAGMIGFSFGVIWIGLVGLLAVGYVFLAMSTVELVRGKITDAASISSLAALHWIAFVVSFLVISGFIAIYMGIKF